MSLAAFRHFVSLHPEITSSGLTTSDIKHAIIKDATKGTGFAFIHVLEGEVDSSGRPFVALATIFVSHVWTYKFVDVVMDVLEQHAAEHPDAYFWFDLFTVDQNKADATSGAVVDPITAAAGFRGPILTTRDVLFVLHPWNNPLPLTRAWCLFEISTSVESTGVHMEGRLPLADVRDLEAGVREDYRSLVQALSDIQAEKATAYREEDRDMIFAAIRASPGGFDRVNNVVKKFLREWYIRKLMMLFDAADEGNSNLFEVVGLVLADFGDYDRAIACYERCLRVQLASLGDAHPSVASSNSNLGSAYSSKGAYQKAIKYFEKALCIRIATLTDFHPDVATSYNDLGGVWKDMGVYEKAIDYCDKSLRIRMKVLGEAHPDVAASYNNLGSIYKRMAFRFERTSASVSSSTGHYWRCWCTNPIDPAASYYGKAIDCYEKSLRIRIAALGGMHPSVLATFDKVLDTLEDMEGAYFLGPRVSVLDQKSVPVRSYNGGADAQVQAVRYDFDKAIKYFENSLRITIAALGKAHPCVAFFYDNLGNAHREKRSYAMAIKYYNESLRIRIATLGELHPSVAASYDGLGNTYTSKGAHDKAIEYYQMSLHIKDAALGSAHPSVAVTLNGLGLAFEEKRDIHRAIEYFSKAASIGDSVLGGSHPRTERYADNLARVRENLRRVLLDFNPVSSANNRPLVVVANNRPTCCVS